MAKFKDAFRLKRTKDHDMDLLVMVFDVIDVIEGNKSIGDMDIAFNKFGGETEAEFVGLA